MADAVLQSGPVGLLCGAGELPLRVAESLKARGVRVVAVAIEGEADPAVAGQVDELHWTGLARLGEWIRIFKGARVHSLLMCGGIRKSRMFAGAAAHMPDLRSAKLWFERLRSREDHTVLGAVADEFEKEGIAVGSLLEFCPELIARPGPLTRRKPSRREWADIRFAWPLAKQVAALQIGQCVVVKDRAVVAVEGIDGTDATLRRGGRLTGGGAVAVKLARDGHDPRFDLPCIGAGTAAVMAEAGVSALAVQAGRTVLLGLEELRRRANRAELSIVAITDQEAAGGA